MSKIYQWANMAQVRKANKRIGNFWFSRDTMRFFQSKVYPTIYQGRYFVSSEQPPYGSREYSVRVVDSKGGVKTANDGFGTLGDARHWARYYAPSELS